jgi:hypothetical protein
MTSNNILDEYPKRMIAETITDFTIDEVYRMTKRTRIKIAKAIWNL